MIDTTQKPSTPYDSWKIESHDTSLGIIDPKNLGLYTDDSQKKTVEGNKLLKTLKGKSVLNATVLDYLYDHQDEIPESWKKDEEGNTRYIYFWGTIYRDSDDSLYVRCLYFYDGVWDRRYDWLDLDWDVQNPAAVLAVSALGASVPLSASPLTLSTLSANEDISKGDLVAVVGSKVMKLKECPTCKQNIQ